MKINLIILLILLQSPPSVFSQNWAFLVGGNTTVITSTRSFGDNGLKLGINIGVNYTYPQQSKRILQLSVNGELRRYAMNLFVRKGGLGAGTIYEGTFINHALHLSPTMKIKLSKRFVFGLGVFYENLLSQSIKGEKSSFSPIGGSSQTGNIEDNLFPNANFGTTVLTQFKLNYKNSMVELSANRGITLLGLNRTSKDRTLYINLGWLLPL